MRDLILYSTLGCHLCERAKEVIWPALSGSSIRLVEVDISEDVSLVEQFGVRIPVVKLAGRDEDLGWPFDITALTEYLEFSSK